MSIANTLAGSLFALAAATATAQTATTAAITQTVQLAVSGFPTVTQATGPLPNATTLIANGGNTSSSQVRITPFQPLAPLGSVGWEVITDLRAVTAVGATAATASVTGRLEFVFYAQAPRNGVLRLLPATWAGSTSPASGSVTLDLGCDGTPEYAADTATYTELPLVVDSTGARICLDLNLSILVPPMAGSNVVGGAFRNWQIEFVPDVYGVEPYAVGCNGGTSWGRGQSTGTLEVWQRDPNQPGPGPTMGGGFLLLGLAPTALTLPVAPFCTQNVAAPTLIAPGGLSNPWAFQWQLPALRLPPGLVFHAQVVWWTGRGMFASTALRSF